MVSEVDKPPTAPSSTLERGLKANWLEALRSGKYSQCAGRLRYDNSYCCLGVLQDVMGSAVLPREIEQEVLSEPHAEKFGLMMAIQQKLADMNDKGATFTEIASYIEANL